MRFYIETGYSQRKCTECDMRMEKGDLCVSILEGVTRYKKIHRYYHLKCLEWKIKHEKAKLIEFNLINGKGIKE